MSEQDQPFVPEDLEGVDVALSGSPSFGPEILLIVRFRERQMILP